MKINQKIKRILFLSVSVIFLFGISACESKSKKVQDNSPWLFKIDDKTITVNQFEQAYQAYLFSLAQGFQLTPQKLLEAANDPNTPLESRQMIRERISRKTFYDQYKTFIMLKHEAEKNGDLTKPDFAGVVDFSHVYSIANYYLAKRQMKENIEISEEEAARAWAQMKQQDPRLAREPIERGLEYARKQLEMQATLAKTQQFIEEVKESYKVTKNDKEVNIEELLEKAPTLTSLDDESSQPKDAKAQENNNKKNKDNK